MKDGREVANYVLDYAESKGFGVTNLSLQKIVYFFRSKMFLTFFSQHTFFRNFFF